MFADHMVRWGLIPDGEPIVTHSSRLLPVRCLGAPAMLKVAVAAEENSGGALMRWWAGDGAARVLAHEGGAILLERAMGRRSLATMARGDHDDEASLAICAAIARLHAPRGKPLPELIPLAHWFRALEPAAMAHGGILADCAAVANELLAAQCEVGVLHGDIHHDNILDFGPRGWLAIDPKGLLGERCFDYANLFCNPDLQAATAPGRFARRVQVVSAAAGIERWCLLRWILAWAGLSAAWRLADGVTPKPALSVAELAAAELERC